MASALPQDRAGLVAALEQAVAAGAFDEGDRLADALCSAFGDQEPSGFVYLAQRDIMNRNPAAAIERLTAVSERFAQLADIPFFIAQAHGALYRHGQAEPFLRRAAELAPDAPAVNFALGRNLFKAGRTLESILLLRKAATAAPTYLDAVFLLGKALAYQDQLPEAETWLNAALALAPDNAEVKAEHEEVKRALSPAANKLKFARWPQAATDIAEFDQAIGEHVISGYDTRGFVLRPGMTVVTQGSCFAGNLAKSFRRYPLNVGEIPFGEDHNNTYSNLAVARWLRDGVVDEMGAVVEATMGAHTREAHRAALGRANLFVYTLGVAPGFFDRETGAFKMPLNTAASKRSLLRTSEFRTTTVEENVSNVTQIVRIVREFNPDCTIILSLSPVPLNSTSEFPSAVVADCLSKSTLRVAAHQLSQDRSLGVLYWPSFEIVRWLSGHYGRVYGNDDGSSHHIDFKVVDAIIDNFIKVFASPNLQAAVRK
jgi:tetratricopeptide (TPR) repeat protein